MTEKLDWTGRVLELEVGPVAHGGHCVARYQGRVVFVRHTLPGEVILAEVTEDSGGGFCRADAIEVRTAAPGRVTPPCPLADMARGRDRCGGCDWQHASAATQREMKAAVVAEQLHRIAGIDRSVVIRELPGGPLRWRSRVRLAVDEEGRTGFRAHRSHRVIPVSDCPITVAGALDEVTSREGRPGTEVEVTKDGTGTVHVFESAGNEASRLVQGSGVAGETAVGRSWELAAGGFWQVHPAAADAFAEAVGRMASAPSGGVAWDLYGGVGLFAAVLADQVGPTGSVQLVESSKDAVRDAKANLRDLPGVQCRTGAVETVLRRQSLPRPDVVVLDPPRKGAGRKIVDAVSAHRPSRVVYVACDPAAMARDIGEFGVRGYRLAEIEGFDAFPMTQHVECVVLLERVSAEE